MLKLLMSCCICFCIMLGTCFADNEEGLWNILKVIEESPDDHEKIVAQCSQFIKATPKDPLAKVVMTIIAWSKMKTGDLAKGKQYLLPVVENRQGTLNRATSDTARCWLTRLDREIVKASLTQIYRKKVEYPENLSPIKALPKDMQAPMTDRWGKPWRYKLVEFKMLTSIKGQKYELSSLILGNSSDINDGLEIPFGSRINLTPVKMTIATPGKESIEFTSADKEGEKIVMTVGAQTGTMGLVYVGKKTILISDRNHWKMYAKPRSR